MTTGPDEPTQVPGAALIELADAIRDLVARLDRLVSPPPPEESQPMPDDHHPDRRRVTGANLIAREREEQVTREGFDPIHDLTHTGQELAWGAFCYLERATAAEPDRGDPPAMWPWSVEMWKPGPDQARMLVKAGALIASEIDRLLVTDGVPEWAKESGAS